MAESPGLMRFALFGMPVAQSLSPAIHHLFAEQCGIAVDYQAVEATPDDFAQMLHDFAASGARGCNITVPLKQLAWKQALSCSASAERAQAANTLVFEGPGDFYADNTDGRGLINDLVQRLAKSLVNSRILIMGAGGAAAGILGDLLEEEPAEVVLVNRTPERANALAQRFASQGILAGCSLDQLDQQGTFDLVINATSLGHAGFVPVMPASLFSPKTLCYDLNYGQGAEPLRKYCENRAIEYRDGLGMLVEQAAISFHLWTGCTPATNPVLQHLRKDH